MTVGRLKTPQVSGGASRLPGGFIHHKRWMLSGLTITITDSGWDAVSFTDFALGVRFSSFARHAYRLPAN